MLRLSWQLGMTVMISKSWPLASVFLLILTNLLASAMASFLCFNNGNYTNNSLYKSNLDTLLSSLSTNIDYNGFYNASTGQNQDTVYASVLCRGDLELNECRTCIQNATADIITSCPNYKQAFQYSDDDLCILRYSNESMFGIPAGSSGFIFSNVQNATNPDQFMLDVRELLDNLREQAANGGSLRKVAAANRTSVGFQNVFSLVQCTPDLSVDDCRTCLIGSVSDIPRYCYGKRGCRIVKPSCLLRYEDLPYYNETRLQELQTLTTPSPPPPPPGKKDNSRTRTTIIIVVSIGVCLIAAAILGILLIKRRKKKSDQTREFEAVHDINLSESLQYDFGEVKGATDDFSDGNKLGQGGFGAVYKGTLSNGQEIAVKRLSMDSGQGDVEFKNEVLLVAKLQHRNLVRLLGFSMERKERLLIYEFVENTSLDRFLFDPIKRNELDWGRRYKIMGGIARGLLYLHEESRIKIIHRDLKASNVLLDGEMNPKIADFGMARLCAADETQANTNRIVGTYGYMSPEYAMHGQFSIKSDVFSFGVLILEIVTGQKNNSFRNGETIEDLLSVAWRRWHQGTIEEMIDPVLRASPGSIRDILRCIHIGLLCVQDDPTDRPTMASTVLMLSSSTISLSVPMEPKFFTTSRFFSKNALLQEYDSKDFGSTQSTSNEKPLISTESSRNVMSITEFYPR